MATQVRRNEERSRYELFDGDDLVGIADYHVAGDKVVMPHTVIEPSRRGRGLGDILVQGALDDVRGTGRTVVPRCWFVAQFLDEHPEYEDLRAA